MPVCWWRIKKALNRKYDSRRDEQNKMSVKLALHYQHFWNFMRVLDSSQIVLQISPDTLCSKIKIQKTMVLQNFQIIFENLIF